MTLHILCVITYNVKL